MGKFYQAVTLLNERESLRAQLSTLQAQAVTAQAETERWCSEYLLLSASCRTNGLRKRPRYDPDPGDNAHGGLTE